MESQPVRGKLHSKRLADDYVALGWQVTSEFRAADDDEPYEILIVWPGPGEPVYPEG
jgi:hypothetical protein